MKKTIALLVMAAALFTFSACQKAPASSSSSESPASQTEQSGSQSDELPIVPNFTLDANNGKEVSLSDYAGKVVVLNFWASWCPPCKKEMPDFQKLHEEFKDSDKVAVLMLNQTDGQRETREKADAFLSENSYTMLNLYDEGQVGFSIFGIQSLPTTVVLDKDGRLSNYVLGTTDYDTVAKMIEEAK